MKVRIKRIDKTLPLPMYKTPGAAAFDLILRESAVVPPGETIKIPCNVVVEIPEGYMLQIVPRSSFPFKKPGLIQGNHSAIIDQDYCGPDDELLWAVYNTTNKPIELERGVAYCQAAFVRIDKAEFEEVEEMEAKNRDGFGSTD